MRLGHCIYKSKVVKLAMEEIYYIVNLELSCKLLDRWKRCSSCSEIIILFPMFRVSQIIKGTLPESNPYSVLEFSIPNYIVCAILFGTTFFTYFRRCQMLVVLHLDPRACLKQPVGLQHIHVNNNNNWVWDSDVHVSH